MKNIVETHAAEVTNVATTVVRENEIAWWVQCEETNCERTITVGKRYYRDIDVNDRSKGVVAYVLTAPERRRCISHPVNATA